MKKILAIGGIIIVLFILIIVIDGMKKSSEEQNNEISTKALQKENSKKEDVIVYFYQTDCVYCKATSPIVIPMAEEMNIDLKKLNLQEDTKGWSEFEIEGTPTIIHFKDGQEVNRIYGQQKEEVFREWFEKNK